MTGQGQTQRKDTSAFQHIKVFTTGGHAACAFTWLAGGVARFGR